MSNKRVLKIAEACRELDVQPYVLRYWETEFSVLTPAQTKSGPRVYSAREIAIIKRIKELLYDEGYTIAGAKKKLENELASTDKTPSDSAPAATDASDEAACSESQEELPGVGEAALDSASEERIQKVVRGLRELRDEAHDLLRSLRDKG